MEFFLEICITAFLSLIFAFLIAKLLSMMSDGGADVQGSASTSPKKFDAEERVLKEEMKNLRLEPEERVEFVGEAVKVDEFQADLAQESLERVREGFEELVLKEEMKNLRLEPEERVEFVGEAVKVNEFEADLAQESLERVRDGCEERVLKEEMKNLILEPEERVEFVGDKAVKVDEFEADLAQESLESLHEGSEERLLKEEMKNLRLEPEERVEFVGEAVKVDESQADLAQESLEWVHEGCEPVEFREDVQTAVSEEDLEGVKAPALEDEFVEERPIEEEVKTGDANIGEVEKGFMSNKDDRTEDNLVEERPETGEVSEINRELAEDKQMPSKDEHVQVLGCESYQEKEIEGREKSGPNDEKGGMSSDEDDWEGIERSEGEELFAAAAAFVGSLDNSDRLSKIGSDVQMQLYALHKVATEGSCHEPQPMALKVSARAKWNAWQGLGNMNPEVAMEQYVSLLSDSVPGWMGENSGGDSKWDSVEAGISGANIADLSTDVRQQHNLDSERKPVGQQSSVEGGDAKWDFLDGGISGAKASDLSTAVHHQHSFETERKPEEHQSSVEGGDAKWDSFEADTSGAEAPDLSIAVHHQHSFETERKPEEHQSSVEGGDATGDPNSLNRDKL